MTKAPRKDTNPPRSGWTTLACAVLILLAGLAAYSDSFGGPFIFDDMKFIDQGARQNVWQTLTSLRPVSQFTFVLNRSLGGGVGGYHAFNLAVHLLAALTLFGVVRRTLMLPSLAPRFGPASTPLAFSIALIWALHPLQTESVTYVVQRMESLMGLFYLLTLYAFIRAAGPLPRPKWYAAAVAACALGMGTKEVMVTAPLAVLLYDRTFLAGSFREALRRRGGFYLALAATWVLLGRQILQAVAPGGASAGFRLPSCTPFEYARTEPGVILHYLQLAFWPAGLCLDYAWPVANSLRDILPGALVVGALLAATIWAMARRPSWGFLGAWFFLILAPTSSVMPIKDLAFEHRMYLSLAAVIAAVTVAAYLLGRRLLPRTAGLALAAVVLAALAIALGTRTYLRNRDYRTAISIWQDTVDKAPRNPGAWYNLAWFFASDGRHSEAVKDYSRAIDLNLDYAGAYLNRAISLIALGRRIEAMSDLNRAIQMNPSSSAAYDNRGHLFSDAGQFEEAVRDFSQAIALKPDFAEAYIHRAVAFARLNRPADALRDFDHGIALKPEDADAYRNRAILYLQMKQFAKAMEDVRTCEKLGGTPDPAFVKKLVEASAQAK